MSSKIYCDVGDVPKGKKRGSMVECAEKGQIKYYGEKKVDKKIIDSVIKRKTGSRRGNAETQLDNLRIKMAGIMGKIKATTRKINDEDDKKEVKKLEKTKKTLEKELDELKDKAINLKKQKDKKQKRNLKRSSSRKSSKRKSSKKSVRGGGDQDYTWICE